MNQFSLVQAVDSFSQGVVITVAPAADWRFDAADSTGRCNDLVKSLSRRVEV
jgi:hypothetical protein